MCMDHHIYAMCNGYALLTCEDLGIPELIKLSELNHNTHNTDSAATSITEYGLSMTIFETDDLQEIIFGSTYRIKKYI